MSIIIKSGSSSNLANVDSLGNFYVLATPAAISTVAAPWTTSTVINTAQVVLTTGGYAGIIVQLNQTSTITGGAVTFEGTYDGINWVSLASNQVLDPTAYTPSANPYTLQPNINHTVLITVGGFQQIRVRLNPAISGTGSVTIYSTLQSKNPIESSGTVTISGTVSVTGTVAISGTVAVTQSTSPWVVSNGGTFAVQAAQSGTWNIGTVTAVTAITNALPAGTNVIGHVITDTGSTTAVTGTVAVTQSGTWSTRTQDGAGNAITSTGNALDINLKTSSITLPVSLTSTTITGTVAVTQSTSPWVISGTVTANAGSGNFTVVQGTASNLNATVVGTGTFAVQAAQSGTWNIGTLTTVTNPVTVVGDSASGAANAGNPVKTGGVFNTTQPTVTNGQTVDSQSTARGATIVATGVDTFNVVASGTVAISGTVAVTQSTSPWVVSLTSTTITGTVAVTQSGTWNIGTVTAVTAITNALPAGTNVIGHVITDTGSTTVVTGTVAVTQSGTWNIGTVTTITNPVTVVGDAASGSAKAGNPVQGGAVFNTTQPTVTNGQVVENQATARGAVIVATGVDTFNVAVSAVSGTVAVTQSTSPWVVSLTSTTITGTVAVTQSGTWNIGTLTSITNALPAGTNVIGHVITDTGSTTAVTGTVTVAGTVAFSNTTIAVTNTGTFAVQATQSGTWTVQQGSAPWSQVGTLTHNNAAPTANNVGVLPAVASSAAPTYTTGDQVLLSTDLAGNLRVAGSLTVSDADTVGTLGALNALNTTATVTTTGQGGVGVLIAAGTLAATVVAEVSYDGGTTWVASVFFDPTANSTSASLVFTNPNAATTRTILIDGGVSNARVRVSVFTSGTANATLRSTFNAGGQYVNQGGTWSVSVPGTVAVTQSTSPWVVSLTSTTITGTVAVTQSTSPWVVSGTVTANAGTGNFTVVQSTAASLNATVVGTGTFAVQASQVGGPWTQNLTQVAGTALGATAVTNFGTAPAATAVMGVNASIYAGTTGITATGSSINANITNTVPVTLTSTTITGTVAVTQSTSPWTIQGDSASGAANAGNPVKIGGVFNTTQPTVTNGQTVDQQSTARGGLIVSTGVDTFNVTVNAALPAGTNVIGHVITDTGSTTAVTGTVTVSGTVTANQGGAPWSQNLTQVAGTSLGATAVTNFGSAPAATAVMGVNANIYSAGAAITAAAPLAAQLSQGGAVLSNTNPIFSSITDGTTKVTVISATAALKTDLSSVAGTATSTAAAGVAKVGIVGNTAATLDSVNTAATAPANALLTSAMYNGTVPALTTGQAVAAECDTTGSLYSNPEGRKQTYRVGVVGFTPIASATAPSISVTGSATKTIRITRIRMSITAGTGGATDISLKRFTALSGGTANSQSTNIAKMDSGNAAQTAVVNQWSVAATTTTAAGIVNAERYEIVTAAVSVLPGVIEWTFGDKQGQSLVLRGTSEFAGFCITAVGTTPVCDCWVEWTEE